MSAQNGRISPIQRKILNLLSDGQDHLREELIALIDEKYANPANLNVYLSRLRTILRPKGQDIVCIAIRRKIGYRHVRRLVNPNNGRI